MSRITARSKTVLAGKWGTPAVLLLLSVAATLGSGEGRPGLSREPTAGMTSGTAARAASDAEGARVRGDEGSLAPSSVALPRAQGAAAVDALAQRGVDTSLVAAVEAARYAAKPDAATPGVHLVVNAAQGLRARVTPDASTVSSGASEVRMALTGIGYGASLASVRALGSTVDGARVAIQKETNSAGRVAVEEWWVNRPAGLEQGFTVTERPDMGAPGEPLRMTLAVTTNLTARALPDETGLEFVDGAGRQALRYDHLVVLDALGRTLPARMRLADGVLTLEADDAGATYPLTIDPTFTQQAYLKPSNTGAGDQFGLSVAVSGDTVVVGAAGEDSSATGVDGSESNDSAPGAGAAYVFVRHGVTWRQQAYLKASNAEAGDSFGGSIAISGDTVVVGAMSERSNASGVNGNQSDNTGVGSGAAYVFVRNGTTWVQQAYLKASNPNAYDSFGRSVAVAGDTVVVGAAGEDSSGMGVNADQSDNGASSAGAAYVFVRDGVTWSQQAYLKASNTGRSDGFGSSLAVAGDTVVVGATGEASGATGVNGTQSDNSAVYAGAAYVFVRNGVTWSQQAYLKASNTDALDRFGRSVAVAGDTVAVGAYLEGSGATGVNGTQSDNSAYRAGAAYVFVRSGTTWSQQAYLKGVCLSS